MHKFVLATLALTLVPVTFAPSLHAQAVELYGTMTEVHGTNVPAIASACSTSPCPYVAPYASVNGLGPGLGMTLNFVRTPGVSLGLDLRGSKHVNGNGADTGFVGIKLAIKPPVLHLTTYIQGSVGYFGTSFTPAGKPADNTNFGAAELLGGVDYPILPHFSIRVLELGVGHAINRPYSGTRPTFVTASSGIVYHF